MNATVIRSLLRLTSAYPWAIPALVVLSLLASLAEGIGIGLLIPLLDVMLDASSTPAGPFAGAMQRIASFADRDVRLLVLAVAIVVLIAMKTVILVANVAVGTAITVRISHDLRVALCRQLLRIGYAFFAGSDQGRLLNTLETQTYRTSEAMALLVLLISSACGIAVFAGLLVLLSWKLTILVFFAALPVSLFVRSMTRRAHHHGSRLVEAHSALAGRMLELLSAMRTIRLFNQESREEEEFEAASDRARHLFGRTERLNNSIQPLLEFLYVPVFLAVLAYAWYTGIGVPSLLTFLLLLFRMQPQLKRLDHARVALGSYAGGVAEVEALLRTEDKPYLESGTRPFTGLEREIAFDGVSFCYPSQNVPALANVSFSIRKGHVVAIVGGSGAGKSTLVSLLCRFYDPDRGSVQVDGVHLSQLDIGSWRNHLAFAGQDADLLTGTVRENIAYGTPQATESDIISAARAAHAEEFIRELPGGYDTQIGTRGLNLSGGQRQRIALARALVRAPDVLILDEATNAVDNMTELAIQQTIEELAGRCTIIIIAHRISTIRRADYVVALAGGKVAEDGSPAELLIAGGMLSKLYELR